MAAVKPIRRASLSLLNAWLLALLLLAAQAAGLSHRISHAPQAAALDGVAGLALQEPGSSADLNAHHAGHQTGHHADHHADPHQPGSADCRLIDQLAHADALCAGDATPGPLPPPRSAAWALDAPHGLASAFALYLARAPPRG